MHVPLEIAEEARRVARELGADCCVTVGGGSTTGLGKAIALTSPLPILAVPTTYAGSEMTPIYGITEGGAKKTGRDLRVLPKAVIYDPSLTLSLPPALSAASGMNAIAHSVEALYAQDANPVLSLMAEEGIRALAEALPSILKNSKDVVARTQALYGAWLCGVALGSAGMALHHKLCHVLGGSFNLPHAETHSIVLPHALAEQRAGGAARDGKDRARDCGCRRAGRRLARADERARRRVRPRPTPRCADVARRDRQAPKASTARPTSRCRTPIPNPRPLEREASARCSSARSTATGRRRDSRTARAVSVRQPQRARRSMDRGRAAEARTYSVSRFTPFSSQA